MPIERNKTNLLKTLRDSEMKTYFVYDESGRMSNVYEARADAAEGDVCLLTEYEYEDGTAKIVKQRESMAVWEAAWDMT